MVLYNDDDDDLMNREHYVLIGIEFRLPDTEEAFRKELLKYGLVYDKLDLLTKTSIRRQNDSADVERYMGRVRRHYQSEDSSESYITITPIGILRGRDRTISPAFCVGKLVATFDLNEPVSLQFEAIPISRRLNDVLNEISCDLPEPKIIIFQDFFATELMGNRNSFWARIGNEHAYKTGV